MKTYRVTHRGHGRMRLNLNAPEFNERSVVVITAAEITTVGDNPRHRFLGDADVWVSNIAPHGKPSDPNNGVEYVLNVAWGDDLNTLIDITVLDSPVTAL